MPAIFFYCKECDKVVEVEGAKEELVKIVNEPESSFFCPWCDKPMDDLVGPKCKAPERVLTPAEFWMAANGGGLPEEIRMANKNITAMLLNNRIVRVESEISSGRYVLKSIELDSGVILKLAASGFGAVVFKVVRKEIEDAASDRRAD